MAHFNHTAKTLSAKVVYYGPALSGKTTNLVALHKLIEGGEHTRLFSLNTREDRTLFFDLLPLGVGKILGYTVRLQLYTVPGQIHYEATRRLVLRGADACVFVADSREQETGKNLASLESLRDNLFKNGLEIQTIPLVFQWNKRDLDGALPVDELERLMNFRRAPSQPAVAAMGEGVVETLRAASETLVRSLLEKFQVAGEPDDAAPADLVDSIFGKFLDGVRPVVKSSVPSWIRTYPKAAGRDLGPVEVYGDLDAPAEPEALQEPPGDDQVQILNTEELLGEALNTQMRIAEQCGELERDREILEKEVEGKEATAHQAYRELLAVEERHSGLLESLAEELKSPLESIAGSVDRLAQAAQEGTVTPTAVEEVREESQRLQDLVREILEARREAVAGVPVDDLIDQARRSCLARAERKGLELEIEVEPGLPDLHGDLSRLGFVLTTFLDTAVQTSPVGGKIRIKAGYKELSLVKQDGPEQVRRFVQIQLRDYGRGFPKEVWEKLFADGPDGKPSSLGTSRGMLRRMGGALQVKSKEGEGNLVAVFFPVAEAVPEAALLDRSA